uniref:Peptidase S1 domain-containing protein n=1 Tax=Anopheles dirus TaxID=7168 RepID=A0A182N9T9_9DIPT
MVILPLTPFQATRIIGSTNVPDVTTYPWIVLITYLDSPNGQGSLINDRTVVTSGTVVYSMPITMHIRALLGVYDRSNVNETINAEEIQTTYLHPGYVNTNQFADNIGLLILKQPLTNSFSTICLPQRPAGYGIPSKATVIGWGASTPNGPLANILQQAELQMYAPLACQMANRLATNKNLCGGVVKPSPALIATCTGDGGDPLVVMTTTTLELVGIGLDIVGYGCTTSHNYQPSMFTNVLSYIDWIITYGPGCECNIG